MRRSCGHWIRSWRVSRSPRLASSPGCASIAADADLGGPGQTDEELAAALDAGVERIHVESLGELERLGVLARRLGVTAPILLRMNLPLAEMADVLLAMGGRPTPFGTDVARLGECFAWLAEHPELRLEGFHFHLCPVSAMRQRSEADRRLCPHVQAWNREHGPEVRHINRLGRAASRAAGRPALEP